MEKDFERLLAKYSEGTLSDEEAEELYRRVTTSPQEAETFRRWREAETLGRILHQMEHLDEEKAWDRLKRHTAPRHLFRRTRLLAAAASLALLTGLGIWLYWYPAHPSHETDMSLSELFPIKTDTVAMLTLSDGREIRLGTDSLPLIDENGQASITQHRTGILTYKSTPSAYKASAPAYNQIRVPAGGSYMLVLSDGTRVHLNADSRLRYPVHFEGTRRVELDGEAYFEVHHEHTPFEVATPTCRFSVLGTVFNIEAYRGKQTVATLVEGCVEVQTSRHTVRLKPGEQAVVKGTDKRPEVRKVNAALYTSWVTGVFHFKDTPLCDIADLLSRWYAADIRCADMPTAGIRLTGSIFRNRELGYTLELLRRAAGLDFEKQPDGSILIREREIK